MDVLEDNDRLLGDCAVRGSVLTLTDLAGFAGAAPGRAERGAALGLQRGSVDVDLAAVVLYRQPAGALHAVCGATATTLEHIRESNPDGAPRRSFSDSVFLLATVS